MSVAQAGSTYEHLRTNNWEIILGHVWTYCDEHSVVKKKWIISILGLYPVYMQKTPRQQGQLNSSFRQGNDYKPKWEKKDWNKKE